MNKIKKIGWVVIVLLAVLVGCWVVLENPEAITVKLFGFEVLTMPAGLWLLIAFAMGCLVGVLATTPALAKTSSRAKKLDRQLSKSQQTAPKK